MVSRYNGVLRIIFIITLKSNLVGFINYIIISEGRIYKTRQPDLTENGGTLH